ncbi:MAG: hypothetical protein ACP5HZ_05480 [Ferrimicrobium sp.]
MAVATIAAVHQCKRWSYPPLMGRSDQCCSGFRQLSNKRIEFSQFDLTLGRELAAKSLLIIYQGGVAGSFEFEFGDCIRELDFTLLRLLHQLKFSLLDRIELALEYLGLMFDLGCLAIITGALCGSNTV